MEVACRFEPAEHRLRAPREFREGAWADWSVLPDHRTVLAFVQAHIVGPWLPALRPVCTLIRDLIQRGGELAGIYPAVNRELCEQMEGHGGYVTLLAAVYDPAARRLTLMNAAHEPPFVVRPGNDCIELASNAPFLGVVDDPRGPTRTETHVLGVQEGDALVLYTDGVLDRYGETDHEFAAERLKRALCKAVRPGADARGLLEVIERDRERLAPGRRHRSDTALLIATF